MSANKVTVTENASRLNESAMSGFDLSNLTEANWAEIGKVINGFAKSAKDDSLNCNPSVLFIRTAKVIKERCNVARLPENVATMLREVCSKVAQTELESLTIEGYVPHRLSKTKNRVDTRNLSVGTQRSLSLRRDNWTSEAQLEMLHREMAQLEKAIERRKLDYKDTEQQETKLASWQRLEKVLKMEIEEKRKQSQSENSK